MDDLVGTGTVIVEMIVSVTIVAGCSKTSDFAPGVGPGFGSDVELKRLHKGQRGDVRHDLLQTMSVNCPTPPSAATAGPSGTVRQPGDYLERSQVTTKQRILTINSRLWILVTQFREVIRQGRTVI